MKTFVAEDVLVSWHSGLIVVKAENKAEAIKFIKKELASCDFIDSCDMEDGEKCYNEYCLMHRLRELRDNEVVYVYGGD